MPFKTGFCLIEVAFKTRLPIFFLILRALDKREYLMIIFLISHRNHMM